MPHPRQRAFSFALAGLIVVWLITWGGYSYFANSKATAEKVAAYLRSVDLGSLSARERAAALRRLAAQMNALTPEERRRARLGGEWERWFAAMTDQEKTDFIEATLPSGFKQMLSSFEQLPEEKRKRTVEEALRGLERSQREMEGADGAGGSRPGTNRMEGLTPELREKVITIGLKSFYTESSAQTKAELAPVLEEMQRLMERGAVLRGPR